MIATSCGDVFLWDAISGTRGKTFGRTTGTFTEMLFSRCHPIFHPDGKTLVITLDRRIERADAKGDVDRMTKMIGKSGDARSVQKAVDFLIARESASPAKRIWEFVLWNYKNGEEIGRFVLEPDPSAIDSAYLGYSTLSPDGKRLACARHNAVHIVNIEKFLP